MKKIFLILVAIFTTTILFSQTLPLPPLTLKNGWSRIYIKNVGYFDLPPSMEVQKGKYKEFTDNVKKIHGFDATQLTAQQKGLNEFGKEGLEKYARVMLETDIGELEDYEKLNFNIYEFTKSDILELNTIFKQQIQQNFLGTGLKLTEWYPLKVEKISGMSCIHISYKRQLNNNPFVLVHMCIFHNNDRMHTFTLSYRLSELSYWQADFVHILKSFRITNIR